MTETMEQTETMNQIPFAKDADKEGKERRYKVLDPRHIEVVQSDNGRAYPHSEEVIQERVASFKRNGQISPVEVRRIDGRYRLTSGYLRHAAAMWIVNNEDPEFMLNALVVQTDEKDAFLRNVAENEDRAELSAVDRAHDQQMMREKYGMSEQEIADRYGVTLPVIYNMKKLMELPEKTRRMVHDGSLPWTAAIQLVDKSEDEQQQIIQENMNPDTGKVRGVGIGRSLRNRNENGEGEGNGETRNISRNVRDLRQFFQAIVENARDEDGNMLIPESKKRFAQDALGFIGGRLTEKQMHNALERLGTATDWK